MKTKVKKLGKFGDTGYTSPSQIKTPWDYIKFIHLGNRGFVTICQKNGKDWIQHFYGTKKQATRSNINKYAASALDTYVGANLLLSNSRGNEKIKRFCAVYADLDTYSVGISPEDARETLEWDYFDYKVPQPTAVIFSGRGLQLVWRISEDPNAAPRWERVQKYLLETLKPLGADPQAVDATRVLRLPYTINTKNGETAKILDICDVTYTLHEIINAYGIEYFSSSSKMNAKAAQSAESQPVTEAQKSVVINIAHGLGEEVPEFENRLAAGNYIQAGVEAIKEAYRNSSNSADKLTLTLQKRIGDYYALAPMRKGVDCGREQLLFLVRATVGQLTGDFEYALKAALEVNERFECPLKTKEVVSATASAEKKLKNGEGYKFRNSTIIEKLKITEEEQKHLSYLKSDRLSRKEVKQAEYLAKLKARGDEPKSVKLKRRREDIKFLLEQGTPRADICDKWGISERTLRRDIVQIKAEVNECTEKTTLTPDGAASDKKTQAGSSRLKNTPSGKTYQPGKWADRSILLDDKAEKKLIRVRDLISQEFSHADIVSILGISRTTLRNYIRQIEEEDWFNANAQSFSFDDNQPFYNVIRSGQLAEKEAKDVKMATASKKAENIVGAVPEHPKSTCEHTHRNLWNSSGQRRVGRVILIGRTKIRHYIGRSPVGASALAPHCGLSVADYDAGSVSVAVFSRSLQYELWTSRAGLPRLFWMLLDAPGQGEMFRLPDSVFADVLQLPRNVGIDGKDIMVRWCWLLQRARDGPSRGTAA